MDQKPIVLFSGSPDLRMKRMKKMKRMALDAIHDDLIRTLRKYAVAYSMVTKYARSAQFSDRKESTPPETPDVERSPVDEAILTTLAQFPFPFPFSSVRELSRRIYIPKSTMHHAPIPTPAPHIITSIHFNSFQFTSRCDIFDGSPTF
jgi:hypothetical protein